MVRCVGILDGTGDVWGMPLAQVLASGDIGPGDTAVLIPLVLDAGRTVRANLTFDAGLLEAIYNEASRRGLTRFGFLASANREKLEGRRCLTLSWDSVAGWHAKFRGYNPDKSQSFSILSSPPETAKRPFGEMATALTLKEWAGMVSISRPVLMSQNASVPSRPPDKI